jgi:hypothetical protein
MRATAHKHSIGSMHALLAVRCTRVLLGSVSEESVDCISFRLTILTNNRSQSFSTCLSRKSDHGNVTHRTPLGAEGPTVSPHPELERVLITGTTLFCHCYDCTMQALLRSIGRIVRAWYRTCLLRVVGQLFGSSSF